MDGPTKQLPRGEREKTRGNPFSNMVKRPIYSLVLRIDPGQSRLLPGQNDEDLERRLDWVKTHELMSVTIGTRANLNSSNEYWSDND